jgi:formate hydrogenlyase subunit 6/NADH:ubiquinone oxidoreductase subunit I
MPFDVFDRLLRPIRLGTVTNRNPAGASVLPNAARGLPVLDGPRCDGSAACVDVCPTDAIQLTEATWTLDVGRCIFCGVCERVCPRDAIRLGSVVELAVRDRDDLMIATRREARS